MKENNSVSVLQSRYRAGAFLGFVCVSALILIGCALGGEMSRSAAAEPSALPHSMKGYELYSWQEGREWHFTLITGTNRLKESEEIVSPENVVTETDWVKLSVQGMEDLRAVLNHLPEGENVFWIGEAWLERVGASEGRIRLPGPQLVEEIESYCRGLDIQLQVAD